MGELAILNVGAGDTKLTFDPNDPAEVERSAGIVRDMIRRGFVLLIEIGRNDKGPIYQRALDFEASTAEYIVAGSATDQEPQHEQAQPIAAPPAKGRPPAKRQTGTRRIPAASASAVAVSRTAGG